MSFEVINNPKFYAKTGFSNAEFKKLDALYLKAAGEKVLTYRTVDCDFDTEVASYTYFKSAGQAPYLEFLIKKVGPRTMMYEVFKHGKGRVAKSGVFDRAFDKLKEEIENLL